MLVSAFDVNKKEPIESKSMALPAFGKDIRGGVQQQNGGTSKIMLDKYLERMDAVYFSIPPVLTASLP